MTNTFKNIKYPYLIVLISILLSICFSCHSSGTKSNPYHEIDEIYKSADKQSNVGQKTLDSLIRTGKYRGNFLGKLYYEKGKIYSNIQKDQLAIINLKKALEYLENAASQDLELTAKVKLFLGSTNIFLGKREEATQYLLEALDICQTMHYTVIKANVYNSLSHVYFTANDYENAINYSIRAIEIQEAEQDSIGLSSTYNNLAIIYKNTLALDEALKYNLLSLELNKKRDDKIGISKSYNNLGQVYELQKNDKLAFQYYSKAHHINQKYGSMNTVATRNMANLFQNQNQLDSAKTYYYNSLKIEKLTNKSNILKQIYESLLRISIKENDKTKSTGYQLKIDSLSTIIYKAENKEKLKALENQYHAIASEKELEQTIKNNNKNRFIFISILILIILLGLYFYQRSKNSTLQLEKEKLILEQRVLRSQMNPHFIFNALSAIQNSLLDQDSIKSAFYLSRFAKLIRQNFDFINQKTISLGEELDALTNYIHTQKLRFGEKFDYSFQIDQSIDLETVTIPPLLLQPFIENSIEHGFKNKKEKGNIQIIISETEDAIAYIIKDNGIGYDVTKKDTKDHAIDIFHKRMKLLESKNEKNFKIHSDENGTTVEFKIKK